jgi:hypothetical protein
MLPEKLFVRWLEASALRHQLLYKDSRLFSRRRLHSGPLAFPQKKLRELRDSKSLLRHKQQKKPVEFEITDYALINLGIFPWRHYLGEKAHQKSKNLLQSSDG